MFQKRNNFSGSFGPKCQEESIPMSLLTLVAVIINGPIIEAQSSASSMPQPILTIAQLLMYNSFIRRRINLTSTSTYRHNQERETPLPIYLGVMIDTKTRKRELVDTLHELGLSISYDRVLGFQQKLVTKFAITMKGKEQYALLSLKMAFSQLLQWTILIIILALLQHMIHFMELGSLCFNIRTKITWYCSSL